MAVFISEKIQNTKSYTTWSEWPRGIKRGSAAAGLLEFRARNPRGAWMSVSCACYVLSGRGFCDGLITCPEESYWACHVWVWFRNLNSEEV